eukprot:4085630-Pyramimonas_sp.AAC.1
MAERDAAAAACALRFRGATKLVCCRARVRVVQCISSQPRERRDGSMSRDILGQLAPYSNCSLVCNRAGATAAVP